MHVEKKSGYIGPSENRPFESSSIGALPSELLIQIFGLLSTQDLYHVSQVCKTFHVLSTDNQLWKPICEENGIFFIQDSDSETDHKTELAEALKGSFAENKPKVTFRDLAGCNFKLKGKYLGFIEEASPEVEQCLKIKDLVTEEIIASYPVKEKFKWGFNKGYFAFAEAGSDPRTSVMTIIHESGQTKKVPLEYSASFLACHENAIGIIPDGWAESRVIHIYDPITGDLKSKLPHPSPMGTSIYFSDTRLATGDAEDTNRIWDINSGKIIHSFDKDGGAHILLLQKQLFISSYSYSNEFKIHDLNCEDPLKKHKIIPMKKNIVGMDIYGNLLAIKLEKEPGVIHLYNIKTGKRHCYTAEEKHVSQSKSDTPPQVKWYGRQLNVVIDGVLETWDFSQHHPVNNNVAQAAFRATQELMNKLNSSVISFWKK